MSILNSLKGMMTNELVSATASHLGESNEGVTKAMGGILPTLLGGLMNSKTEDHSMISGLLTQAGNATNSSSLVGDIMSGVTGGSNSGITGLGSSLISGLLGNKMGMVGDLISNFSGVKSSSTNSLMGIGGSLIASYLGNRMTSGMDFSGIMNMLKGEKEEISAATPAGFASSLGFSDVAHKVAGAASAVTSATSTITGGDDDNKGGGMKWLLPLLLLALLGAGIAYWMKGCNKTNSDTTTVTTADTTAATSTNTIVATDTAHTETTTARENAKIKLADGVEINAYKGGVEDKIVAFLTDPNAKLSTDDKTKDWFDFDNLNFDLGKSTITKESMVQVDNLAAILKAYPTLKIKVGGYTDKKGDDAANMKLSQSRADAVFAALKAKGANAEQLVKAEGYGETLAKVDENATDEARRADRRTAVRILAK